VCFSHGQGHLILSKAALRTPPLTAHPVRFSKMAIPKMVVLDCGVRNGQPHLSVVSGVRRAEPTPIPLWFSIIYALVVHLRCNPVAPSAADPHGRGDDRQYACDDPRPRFCTATEPPVYFSNRFSRPYVDFLLFCYFQEFLLVDFL